jgi:hypothetical protein
LAGRKAKSFLGIAELVVAGSAMRFFISLFLMGNMGKKFLHVIVNKKTGRIMRPVFFWNGR